MPSLDGYLHVIGLELLTILGLVTPLLNEKASKRVLSSALLLVLAFMLMHFVTHLLPDKIADFIYSAHHSYRSIKTTGMDWTWSLH